jgi:pilus assembly protein Flp/PilA
MSKLLLVKNKLTGFLRRKEEGASLVEYGLLVGLIAVVCLAAITLLGQNVNTMFQNIAAAL